MKRIISIVAVFAMLLCFAACTKNGEDADTGSKIVLSDAANGALFTITEPGEYVLSGTLSDGQIVVDCVSEGNVKLIFDGLNVTCSTSAPIYVKEAEKVIIAVKPDTTNTITDKRPTRSEEEPNAAIFSHDDMEITIEGSGDAVLNVVSEKGNAITSKDKLTISGATINVRAGNHGIRGKDRLKITGGVIDVFAGADGLRATNDTESDKGNVIIEGGVISVDAADEAIDAYNTVEITGGVLKLVSSNNAIKADNRIILNGGVIDITAADDAFVTPSLTGGTAVITVNGSTYTVE